MRRNYNQEWKAQLLSPQPRRSPQAVFQTPSTLKHTPSKTRIKQPSILSKQGYYDDITEGMLANGVLADGVDQSSVNRVQQLIRGDKSANKSKFTDLKSALQPSLGENWNESILSVLKSNENYRRQLLAAIEEKAKIQAEKSQMQKELVSTCFQKDQLAAEKRELNVKINFLNKNIAILKEDSRKQVQNIEAAMVKLKHEGSMAVIERETAEKGYGEVMGKCNMLEEQLQRERIRGQEMGRGLDEAKGQINFLVSKLAQNEQDNFVSEQQFKDLRREKGSIQQKLQKANTIIQNLKGDLMRLEQRNNNERNQYTQKLQEKQCLLQQNAKDMGKYQAKIKELLMNQQISKNIITNLQDSLNSYQMIEEQNAQLRNILSDYSELKKEREQLMAENDNLKATKQHFEVRLLDQRQMVQDMQKEYQDLVKVVQQREKEQYIRFTQQIKQLLQKIEQQSSQKQLCETNLQKLRQQLSQKQKQINEQRKLNERLQAILQEKISRLSKYQEQGVKLKEILQKEAKQVQEQKMKVEELDESLQQGKHQWQQQAEINKMTLMQKENLIMEMMKQLGLVKIAKEEDEVRWKESNKRWEDKQTFLVKQIELIRSKSEQLQKNQRQLQEQLQKAKSEQRILRELELQQNKKLLNMEQSYDKLQHQVQTLRQKCQQFQKSLALEHSSKLVLKDHEYELQVSLRQLSEQLAQNRRQQRQRQDQYQHQLHQRHIILQQKQRKSLQFVKNIYKQFTMAKTYITQIRACNFHSLQRYSGFLPAGQRYNFCRELQKAMEGVSQAGPLGSKIEKALQQIRMFLEIKQVYQNELLVKEGNIYRLNRLYSK